jgi:HAD domain in Swiss Army Knife RNA repair proteins
MDAQRPVLFVDVDGVISLFGFEPSATITHALSVVDGELHWIASDCRQLLSRLAERFELVWATGWEHRASESLAGAVGEEIAASPYLTFDGRAVFGSAHWKLEAITEYAGTRPAAWIDDNIDDACRLWAMYRETPTLLVKTRSAEGLTEGHVQKLLQWADEMSSVAAA